MVESMGAEETERLLATVSPLDVMKAAGNEGFNHIMGGLDKVSAGTLFAAALVIGKMQELETLEANGDFRLPAMDIIASIAPDEREAVKKSIWESFRYGYYQALSDTTKD